MPRLLSRHADALAAVEFILCFDRLLDAVQACELRRCARTWGEATLRSDGRPCSVVHGTMPYQRLLGLHFCRRNSTCAISVPVWGIEDHIVWVGAQGMAEPRA